MSGKCSAPNGTSTSHPLPPRLRTHHGRGDNMTIRTRNQEKMWNYDIFRMFQGHCILELGNCGCLQKIKPVSIPAWVRESLGSLHPPSCHHRWEIYWECLASEERKIRFLVVFFFFSGMWPWVDWRCFRGWFMTMGIQVPLTLDSMGDKRRKRRRHEVGVGEGEEGGVWRKLERSVGGNSKVSSKHIVNMWHSQRIHKKCKNCFGSIYCRLKINK